MENSPPYDKILILLKKIIPKFEPEAELGDIKAEKPIQGIKQILSLYEEKTILFGSILNQYLAWVSSYKIVFEEFSTDQIEQIDIYQFMCTIIQKIDFSKQKNLQTPCFHKILQENTIRKRWSRSFLECWKKNKKDIQERENKGMTILQSLKKDSFSEEDEFTPQFKDLIAPDKTQFSPQKRVEKTSSEKETYQRRIGSMILKQKKYTIKTEQKKKIGQYLSEKLRLFMRQIIEKVILFSRISNKKLLSDTQGDEFRYFSSKSIFLNLDDCLFLPKTNDVQFMKVCFPSKLQLFNNLILKEQSNEEEMEQDLKDYFYAKRRPFEKKLLDEYLFDNSEKIKVTKKTDKIEAGKTIRLRIELKTIQYVLERHPYFHDSHILQSCFSIY